MWEVLLFTDSIKCGSASGGKLLDKMDKDTSRHIVVSKTGSLKNARIETTPILTPGPGEVTVRVAAIGLNFADLFAIWGLYSATPDVPFVPGFEVSGEITELGQGVDGLKTGQRIMAATRFGAYSEKLVLPSWRVAVLPKGWSFEEGAAFLTTFLTAHYGLHTLGQVRPDQRVVVHSAAGGVGSAALQLATASSCSIFATVGSDTKIQYVRNLGIKFVLNYRQEDFLKWIREVTENQGVDVVLDSIGGRMTRLNYLALRPRGRLVCFGSGSWTPTGSRPNWLKLASNYLFSRPTFAPLDMISENKTIAGFNLIWLTDHRDMLHKHLEALLELVAAGTIRPLVGRVFPFEQYYEALTWLQSGRSTGKVVLKV